MHGFSAPVQAPDQATKTEPGSGCAVRTTFESATKAAEQLHWHETPAGEDVTVPNADPESETLNVDVELAVCRSLFGSPQQILSRPIDAFALIASQTWAGVSSGAPWRISAAAPATCGLAIEVPLLTSEPQSDRFDAEVTLVPGANRSLHGPKFE